MNILQKALSYNHKDIFNKKVLLLFILVAYSFNVFIRLHYANYNERFMYNGSRMITCIDGYFYGTLAKKQIKELEFINFFNGKSNYLFSYLTTAIVKSTPFTIEQVMAYLPVFFSCLMIIPIILIGRIFRKSFLGFIAALIVPICPLLYQRTLFGWYDTDMIAFVFPLFLLYFLLKYLTNKKLWDILLAAFFTVLSISLYTPIIFLNTSIILLFLIYNFFIEKDKNSIFVSIILIISISLHYITPIWLLLPIGLFFILKLKNILNVKIELILFSISTFYFLFFTKFPNSVWGKLFSYISRDNYTSSELNFLNVNTTIIETAKTSFEEFTKDASGHLYIGILGILGYFLFILKNKKFIISLPLLGLGLFSMVGGIRFAAYSSFILIFGFLYSGFVVTNYIINTLYKDFSPVKISLIRCCAVLLIAIHPFTIIKETIKKYQNLGASFQTHEAKTLYKLAKISTNNDYAIAWWDYGYLIPFYAGVKTIINGAKHGRDNFIVSKILQTNSQMLAANFARLAVEVYAKYPAENIITKILVPNKNKTRNPNALLKAMKSPNFKRPKKTRDIFIYLPYHMLRIFPNVKKFGEIDLTTGKFPKTSVIEAYNGNKKGDKIYLSSNMYLNINNFKSIYIANKVYDFNKFVIIDYKNGKYKKQIIHNNKNSNYNMIYMRRTNQFILLDKTMYNSLYIKLFFLKEYDPNLFELSIDTEWLKIYKLKV